MAFNPDEFLKSYGKTTKQTAKPGKFDPDEFLAGYKLPEEEAAPLPVAPPVDYAKINSDAVKAKLREVESRPENRTQEVGFLNKIKAALSPREILEDLGTASAVGLDRASFGLSTKLAEKAGLIKEGALEEGIANRPVSAMAGEVLGMGLGIPTGSAAGTAAQNAVSMGAKIAPKIAKAIPSPIARVYESALAGGLYSGADAAMRGDSISDAAQTGALISGGVSAVPAIGKVLGKGAQELRTRNAVSELVRSRKKNVEKALSQLGGDDVEMGKKELKDLIKREGLVDVLDNPNVKQSFKEKKQEVWNSELGPIHEKALELEPEAKVNWKEIDAAAKKLINDAGASTPKAQTVRKALSDLKARASDAGYGKDGLPITEALENARALQESGWAGVANFESPTDIKQIARDFGGELRGIYDKKLNSILRRHLPANEVAEMGAKYRTGNERYSDLSKLNDPIESMIGTRQTERKGLIRSLTDLKRQGVAAYLGHALGGPLGAAIAVGGNELARRGTPAALRATSKLAKGDGKPVSARTSAIISQWLKNYMGGGNDGEGE